MSYMTTGNFYLALDNIANPTVVDPMAYVELKVYRYMSNSSDIYPTVCGGNKWALVKDSNGNEVMGPPLTNKKISGTTVRGNLALNNWFKAGDRFLITLRQWKFGDESQRKFSSPMSRPSCYENKVEIGFDQASKQFEKCVNWGYVGEMVRYVWDATGAGKILGSKALATLKSKDKVSANLIENGLKKVKSSKGKTIAFTSKTVGKGVYEIQMLSTDDARALEGVATAVEVLATITQASGPVVTFVTETISFLAGMDDMADRVVGNCEKIWDSLER